MSNSAARRADQFAPHGYCDQWSDDVCLKTYYKDDKCEKPTGQTFFKRELVCEP